MTLRHLTTIMMIHIMWAIWYHENNFKCRLHHASNMVSATVLVLVLLFNFTNKYSPAPMGSNSTPQSTCDVSPVRQIFIPAWYLVVFGGGTGGHAARIIVPSLTNHHSQSPKVLNVTFKVGLSRRPMGRTNY
jgi:hypothetical protein